MNEFSKPCFYHIWLPTSFIFPGCARFFGEKRRRHFRGMGTSSLSLNFAYSTPWISLWQIPTFSPFQARNWVAKKHKFLTNHYPGLICYHISYPYHIIPYHVWPTMVHNVARVFHNPLFYEKKNVLKSEQANILWMLSHLSRDLPVPRFGGVVLSTSLRKRNK